MEPVVIVALIAAFPAVLGTILTTVVALRQSKVKKDIQTNHGLRPGEYLEMVAEVRSEVADTKSLVVDLKQELAAHTQSDTSNFNELRKAINASA